MGSCGHSFFFFLQNQCPGGFWQLIDLFGHEKQIICRFFQLEALNHKLLVKHFTRICRDYCSECAIYVKMNKYVGLIQVFNQTPVIFYLFSLRKLRTCVRLPVFSLKMKREKQKNGIIREELPLFLLLCVLVGIRKWFKSDKTSWDHILLLPGSARAHKYLKPNLNQFPILSYFPLFTSSAGGKKSVPVPAGPGKRKKLLRSWSHNKCEHDGLVLLPVLNSHHPVPGPFCCFCRWPLQHQSLHVCSLQQFVNVQQWLVALCPFHPCYV